MTRENLLNILMYVFENYLEEDTDVSSEEKNILNDMLEAGFEKQDINKALGWFGELNLLRDNVIQNTSLNSAATRIFTDFEVNKITLDARGYLIYLEQSGIIDAPSRELVIDRAMALEEPCVDVAEIKWVTLMVLFSQHDKEDQLKIMEELILIHEDSEPH